MYSSTIFVDILAFIYLLRNLRSTTVMCYVALSLLKGQPLLLLFLWNQKLLSQAVSDLPLIYCPKKVSSNILARYPVEKLARKAVLVVIVAVMKALSF